MPGKNFRTSQKTSKTGVFGNTDYKYHYKIKNFSIEI
jgi:hypothetical protein